MSNGAADLETLARDASALGISLDSGQLARYARYRTLLLDWNRKFNLTAITDPEAVVTRHFLDSLTVALGVPQALHARSPLVLDVGSGAGFPGLALAIAFPTWRVTLLEATGKKVRFLEAAIGVVGAERVQVLAGRAEDMARRHEQRGVYDIVTARAVAALPTLVEFCAPFAAVGGRLVLPRKGDLASELARGERAAALVGARLLDPVPIALAPLDDGRVLVIARQERPCPAQYPRAGGAPLKKPLGA
jgi:16S rRNA (guanine527-N7)-methyltransferase